ncbi:MAG: hypothetical protein AAF556_04030, partial [Pseudomonadota bacterium]
MKIAAFLSIVTVAIVALGVASSASAQQNRQMSSPDNMPLDPLEIMPTNPQVEFGYGGSNAAVKAISDAVVQAMAQCDTTGRAPTGAGNQIRRQIDSLAAQRN